MDFLPIRRALLSVTHKDGLAEFALKTRAFPSPPSAT